MKKKYLHLLLPAALLLALAATACQNPLSSSDSKKKKTDTETETGTETGTDTAAYTVTYDGNGADAGSVPVDSKDYKKGATVTVLGNTGGLAEGTGIFGGWNTAADRSGTSYAEGATFAMGSADMTLYAMYGDVVPPGDVVLSGVQAGDSQIVVSWTEPSDSDFDHVAIAWDGDNSTTVAKGTTSCTISGLTTGTTYTVTLRAVDSWGNYSSGVIRSVPVYDSTLRGIHDVATADDLYGMRDDLTGCYTLSADIDLSGYSPWTPIGGSSSPFKGVVMGNNHTISNMTCSSSSAYLGLFGSLSSARVQDIALANVNISNTGYSYHGGLAGSSSSTVLVSCSVSGTAVKGNSYVGGLVGEFDGGTITDCHTTLPVAGSFTFTGGLVGYLVNSFSVSNSSVSGKVSGYLYVGGLIGWSSGSSSTSCLVSASYVEGNVSATSKSAGGLAGESRQTTFSDCYSIGNVSCPSQTGGIFGYCQTSPVKRCYAAGSITGSSYVKALVGYYYSGTFSNCIYDSDTCGQTDTHGTGYDDDTMKAGGFANWDFTDSTGVWMTGTLNGGYPYLRANPPAL